VAYYESPAANGVKHILGGTLVGRTYTERGTSTPFGPWAASDDEVFLLAYDVLDANRNPSFTALKTGKNVAVFENFLPDYAAYSAPKLAALRAAYITQIGRD
jgi:hypothetical protein